MGPLALESKWLLPEYSQDLGKSWMIDVFYKCNPTVTFVGETEKYPVGLQSEIVGHVCINHFYLYLDS